MKIFFFFFFFFFFTFQLNLRFQVVATAVARVYKSMHGSWSYTNHMGAVALVKEHATHMLKLINLDSGNVDWSQELYEGFEYNAPKAFFHTFEGDDACYAFSFADDSDPCRVSLRCAGRCACQFEYFWCVQQDPGWSAAARARVSWSAAACALHRPLRRRSMRRTTTTRRRR
jgi:hypothetical protein